MKESHALKAFACLLATVALAAADQPLTSNPLMGRSEATSRTDAMIDASRTGGDGAATFVVSDHPSSNSSTSANRQAMPHAAAPSESTSPGRTWPRWEDFTPADSGSPPTTKRRDDGPSASTGEWCVSASGDLVSCEDGLPPVVSAKDNADAEDAEKKKKEKKEKKQADLKKSAAGAFKPLFYDNDFGYLNDPEYRGHNLGDRLKQIELFPGRRSHQPNRFASGGSTLDIGGQYRFRFHSERNHRGLGLTGNDDQFMLQRTRLFANLRVNQRLRFYGEYIDAVSQFEDLNPRPIEENRSDMLNLFVDGVLIDSSLGKLSGRAGRQELLYGAQRMVSPLDWANTRRPFDGFKLMWKTDQYQLDGFWTRPLRTDDRQFDNPNQDQQFYGIYSAYKGKEKGQLDGFWMAFDNDRSGLRTDSIGGRYYDEFGDSMLEMWGNYQFGDNAGGSSHDAGAVTVGLGHRFGGNWKPTCWVYYDWASGSDEIAAGDGYFQYFPLAHKYLGFMDLFGRRNVQSPNVQISIQPTKKWKLLAWYYYFFLEDRDDTPYSVVMTPFAPGVTPGSSDLGHEIDLMATYTASQRSKLVLGYSHFFSGDYYRSDGVPYDGDADFFYTQYHVNF